jgi:phosphoribosylanthranilate isomerase
MWVKICGVRDEATAEGVCRLSPDAIGLNFYAKSPRVVAKDVAARISKNAADRVQCVGVFVNHSVAEIEDVAGACRLAAVQLHGDETATMIAELVHRLPDLRVFRAWRMDGDSLAGLERYLADCRSCGVIPAGCLIDSRVPGTYGGTGRTVPWDALVREYQRDLWPPLVLAGGLAADNVATAIRVVLPWGVDVASGVESAPGIKDLDQVRQFIENARRA